MAKRLLTTPRSQVRSALRRLFLRSRERGRRIKEDHYTCQVCGAKKSVAKGREVAVEVHHREGVQWEALLDLVYEMLLCSSDKMITLCQKCHDDLEGRLGK